MPLSLRLASKISRSNLNFAIAPRKSVRSLHFPVATVINICEHHCRGRIRRPLSDLISRQYNVIIYHEAALNVVARTLLSLFPSIGIVRHIFLSFVPNLSKPSQVGVLRAIEIDATREHVNQTASSVHIRRKIISSSTSTRRIVAITSKKKNIALINNPNYYLIILFN